MAKQDRGSFGKIAIDAGYITDDGLREAMFFQSQIFQESGEKVNLGKILLDKGFMTKEQILEVLSLQAKDIYVEGFEIHSKLGAGNMGAVYYATHIATNKQVALKIIADKHKNERFLKRFEVEFDVLKKLKHPNIVEGIALEKNGPIHYYAMEFVEGKTLRDLLKVYPTLPIKDSIDIIRPVCEALQYAISHGIFHRDIKPDNLLIEDYDPATGKIGKLKIIDFGLAKDTDVDSNLTMEGTGMGTPLYMAPEQVKDAKNVDFRADIYSLGATLFKMLTGHNAAYGKSSMEIVANVVKGNVRNMKEFNLGLAENVYQLVDKMMALDVKKRYQDYESLLKDMDVIYKGLQKKPKAEKIAKDPNRASKVSMTVVEELATTAASEPVTSNSEKSEDIFASLEQITPPFNIIPNVSNKDLFNFLEPILYICILLICFFIMLTN